MSDKRKHLRKKRAASEDEEPEDRSDTSTAVWDKLQDTKLLQKQRHRHTGLTAEALALGARAEQAATPQVQPAHQDGNELLEAYVKEQVTDTAAVDPHMERYIEDQMRKRGGLSSQGDDADTVKTVQQRDEEELYRIPDNLKGQVTKQGDVASYMTGITEVELPLEYKLKNIEETEAAKMKMLQQAGGLRRRLLEEDEDREEHRPRHQHAIQAQRGAYPRDFGRQKAADDKPSRPVDKAVRTWTHKRHKPVKPVK